MATNYEKFFNKFNITQVIEIELESSFWSSRIKKEIYSAMNEILSINGGMAFVYFKGIKKEFGIFCVARDFDNGSLWAYGFAEPNDTIKTIPALIRHNGLPTDMQKIVRAIQKEYLLCLINKIFMSIYDRFFKLVLDKIQNIKELK